MIVGKRNKAVTSALWLVCSCRLLALNPSLDVNQYAHKSWKAREGYFKGSVTAIKQTPDGYLWVGTEFGLYRFDGVRSVLWEQGHETLPSSVIRQLFVSKDGALWIATAKGPVRWDGKKLTRYPELQGEELDAFAEDRDGTIWGGVESGLAWRLCAIRGDVQCFGEKGSLGLGVGTLLSDSKGRLWAGTGTALWQWRTGSPEPVPLTGAAAEIHSMIENQDGSVLLSTRAGLLRILDGKISPYRIPDYEQPFVPFGLLRDRDGTLWIGTRDRGLLHVHQGSTDHFGMSDGLASDSVQDLFEDAEGNIWVATASGLDCFTGTVAYPISAKPGIRVPAVESLLIATDGSVWLGTRNGLDRWRDEALTLYRKDASQPVSMFRRIIDPGLPDDLQGSLFEDHSGRIWVFSRAGAAQMDENGRFHPVPGMPGGFAHAVAEDSAGGLWIGQDQALFHLVPGGKVEEIPWTRFASKDRALALAVDPSGGGLWLGFSKGNIAYLRQGEIRRWYSTAEGLGAGRVHKLHMEEGGILWAATEGGLSRVTAQGIQTLSSRNGLPCDSINSLVIDAARSMWLDTACGLVRVTLPDLEAWSANPKLRIRTTVLDNSDGFTSFGFRGALTPRMGAAADGKIWVVTREGVIVADPRQLSFKNPIQPPVHIEQITANGKRYAPANGLRLPARVRDLTIDYTALSLVAPEKVHFRFKLEEQDRDWREVVNGREVQYSNLPPGGYRFRVMACNNSGVWNEKGDALQFSIAPAYYQTSWFFAICAAAFLAAIWGIYRLRLYQIAREFNAQLEGRVEERLRVARDLHDTLLQTFQAALLQMQAAYNMFSGRPEKAAETLRRAIAISADAIAQGRDAIQNMRLSTVVNNDLARDLRTVGSELAAQSSASFDVKVQGLSRDVHPILRDEVYRIGLEAIRNAFQHAEARAIEVEILYGDSLRMRIRDDGKGMNPAILKEGSSGHFGIPGMQERAARFGGKLELWSGPGAGTEIQLSIPGRIAFGTSGKATVFERFRRNASE